MNELEKCAEILVASKYAQYEWINLHGRQAIEKYSNGGAYLCEPFEDTLEGRRQADAIEDWLWNNEIRLWGDSAFEVAGKRTMPQHQWRLNRIKWCIQESLKKPVKCCICDSPDLWNDTKFCYDCAKEHYT